MLTRSRAVSGKILTRSSGWWASELNVMGMFFSKDLVQYPRRRIRGVGLVLVDATRVHFYYAACLRNGIQCEVDLFPVPWLFFHVEAIAPVVHFDLVDMTDDGGRRGLHHLARELVISCDSPADTSSEMIFETRHEDIVGIVDLPGIVYEMHRADSIIEAIFEIEWRDLPGYEIDFETSIHLDTRVLFFGFTDLVEVAIEASRPHTPFVIER